MSGTSQYIIIIFALNINSLCVYLARMSWIKFGHDKAQEDTEKYNWCINRNTSWIWVSFLCFPLMSHASKIYSECCVWKALLTNVNIVYPRKKKNVLFTLKPSSGVCVTLIVMEFVLGFRVFITTFRYSQIRALHWCPLHRSALYVRCSW